MTKVSRRLDPLYRFEWSVDQSGYRLERRVDGVLQPLDVTILGSETESLTIEAIGGPARMTRPLEDSPALWRDFATCRTPTDFLDFTRQHGLPFHYPNGQGVPVKQMKWIAEKFGEVAKLMDMGDPNAAITEINEVDTWPPHMNAAFSSLIVFEKNKPVHRPVPRSLFAAMLVQAAQSVCSDRDHRRCPTCGSHFIIGQGFASVRREFCSNACRAAASRQRHKGPMIAEGL